MLAIRPDLVDLEAADAELATELQAADAQRGHENTERFVASIVASVRATDPSR